MQIFHRRSVVLLRFAISYFIILVVPVIVIGTIFLENTAGLVREDADKTAQHLLQQSVNQISFQMDNLSKVNDQISMNESITRSHLQNHLYYGEEIIQALHALQTCYPLLKNTYLYADDSDYVYSATSTIGIKRFVKDFTGTTQNPQTFANSVSRFPVMKVMGINGGHYVYFPLRHKNSAVYGFVLLQIDLNFIKNIISNYIPADGGTVYIENDEEELLLVSGQKIIDENEKVYLEESERYRMHFRFYPLKNDMVRLVDEAHHRILLQLLLVFCGGSVFVFFFTYMSYNPINKLKRLMENLSGKKNTSYNEFKDIEKILLQLSDADASRVANDPQTLSAVRHYLLM